MSPPTGMVWSSHLVNREFTAKCPDEGRAADVTRFWTIEGWLYFTGVIDLYSRRVVAWSMSNHPDADLIIDALLQGFERRRPDQELYDHAVVESLWATVKRNPNWIYDRRTWTSRHLLRSAIFDYIEGFYNPERIQKLLGYRSPADFESKSVA